MKLSYKLNKMDYDKFYKYCLKRDDENSSNRIKYRGTYADMVFWILLIFLAMFYYYNFEKVVGWFHWPTAILLILTSSILISFYFYLQRGTRKILKHHSNLLFSNQEIHLHETGIIVTTTQETCKIKWGAIQDIADNEGNIYLYLSKYSALIIPSSCFINENDKNSFLSMVKSAT